MLAMPAPNQFDLKFTLLGIPVRINPFFWVLAAGIGWQDRDGFEIVIWVACVLASIMVHEFGHALTGRALSGLRPTVALYWLGGLCGFDREARSPWRRIVTLLMGPGAGFLLGAAIAAIGIWGFGYIRIGPFFEWASDGPRRWHNVYSAQAYEEMLWINLFWGLANLLPIFPLDGGQIAGVLLSLRNKYEGPKWTHVLSMVTAGIVAFLLYQRKQEMNAFFVLLLGLTNLQLYQAARYQGYEGNGPEEDDDWWRK